MTLPKRLLDSHGDADDFERSVLRSELDAPPPSAAELAVFARVLAAAAPVVPSGVEPSPSVEVAAGGLGKGALATSAATLVTLGKGFVLGIGVSFAGFAGSHFLVRSPTPPESDVRLPSVEVARVARSVEPGPSNETERAPVEALPGEPAATLVAPRPQASPSPPEPRVAAPPSEAAAVTPSVASFPPSDERALAASRLKEEAALLHRARAELRAGALAAAFATLEASRQKFTAPELSQEREALVIELLHRSGERAAAGARALEFLARFPESPHATAVRAFVGERVDGSARGMK
ncbi:MAG TPA: hypothetical protein VFZ53_30350 [Polyangiaceae bacterium]